MNTHLITAVELAALRQANEIVFRHRSGNATPYTVIEAVKKAPARATVRNPFVTDSVVCVRVETELLDYSSGTCRARYGNVDFDAFASVSVYSFEHGADEWSSIARNLRVGDELTVRWVANNDNDYMRAAGLHRDEVKLVVRRRRGEPLTFHICSSNSPDNCARHVRRLDRAPSMALA